MLHSQLKNVLLGSYESFVSIKKSFLRLIKPLPQSFKNVIRQNLKNTVLATTVRTEHLR